MHLLKFFSRKNKEKRWQWEKSRSLKWFSTITKKKLEIKQIKKKFFSEKKTNHLKKFFLLLLYVFIYFPLLYKVSNSNYRNFKRKKTTPTKFDLLEKFENSSQNWYFLKKLMFRHITSKPNWFGMKKKFFLYYFDDFWPIAYFYYMCLLGASPSVPFGCISKIFETMII